MIEFKRLRIRDMPALLRWRRLSPDAWRDPSSSWFKQFKWLFFTAWRKGWIRGVYEDGMFVAQTQLYPIDKRKNCGEIGIVVNPEWRGLGLGKYIVWKTLLQGFHFMKLDQIWGEAYLATDARKFWFKICPNKFIMPKRSLYFWWLASEWDNK
jgi:GNAT superfamily N-acetyltransferase